MNKKWYHRPSWWGAIVVGSCSFIQGVASVEAAWDFVRRTVPSLFRVINPIVSFFTRSISIPIWVVIFIGGWFLLRIVQSFMFSLNHPPQKPLSPLFANPAKFRDVWIDWYTARASGPGIPPHTYEVYVRDPMRCAKDRCNKRIASVARIHEGKFLVCEAGHFVGNEEGYDYWKQKFIEGQKAAIEAREKKIRKAREQLEKMEAAVEAGEMTEEEVEKWKREQPGDPDLGGEIPVEVDDSWFIRAARNRGEDTVITFIDAFKEAREHALFERRISKQTSE